MICLEQDSSTNRCFKEMNHPQGAQVQHWDGEMEEKMDLLTQKSVNFWTQWACNLFSSAESTGNSTQSVTAQSCTHAASTLTGTFQGHRRNISIWKICASSVMPCSTPAFLYAMIHVQIRHKNRQELADWQTSRARENLSVQVASPQGPFDSAASRVASLLAAYAVQGFSIVSMSV